MTDLPPPPPNSVPPGWSSAPPTAAPPPPPGYVPYPVALSEGQWFGYANFGQRLAARLLDSLVALVPALPGYVVMFAGTTGLTTTTNAFGQTEIVDASPTAVALFIIGGALLFIGMIVYQIWFCRRVSRTGQSIGMKVCNIKLVGIDRRNIGAWKVFWRFFTSGIISGCVCYLGFLWCIWDADRQTWHDKVFNTVSVKTQS
jgi:uncharacterized RDD family membrane protein YckC